MEEYYLLYIIFPLILGLWAQFLVHSKYNKWSQVRSAKGLRGRDAAAAVMEQAGIHDVEIVRIEGKLTDHYDPIHRRLALSRDNYDGTSLAALGISAHEAGHAIQHKEMYAPLQWRSALIPITNIKEVDLLRDELVMEIVNTLNPLFQELREAKINAIADVRAFVDVSAEKYGVKPSKKGNVTLYSFDGKWRVTIAMNDVLTFDERLQSLPLSS